MTDKIKDRITGWIVTLLFSLLGFIAAGVGWLIVENTNRIERIEMNVSRHDASIIDLNNATQNLINAYNLNRERDKEQDKEILELWKCAKRSGNARYILDQ